MLEKDIGKYRILKWLGGGRFGDTYLVEDKIIKELFVIKYIPLPRIEGTSSKNFPKDEIKALLRLNHPNIVRIFSYDIYKKGLVIVMEYVRGERLSDYIVNNKMSKETILSLFNGLLSGLCYAHKNNIIHRDLKPDNIIITSEPQVKIIDFGLSLFFSKTDMYVESMPSGTPVFMSEEAFKGRFFKESDIFSLGLIFAYILSYRDFNKWIKRHAEKTNRFLSFNREILEKVNVSQDIKDLIYSMLDKDPYKRPSCEYLLKAVNSMSFSPKSFPAQGKIVSDKTLHLKGKKSFSFTKIQKDIIEYADGNILVIGDAGVGKTFTLVHKAIGLLRKRILNPEEMVIMSFSKKQVEDIKNKLYTTFPTARHIFIDTFHGFIFQIMKRFGEYIGLKDFDIVDSNYMKKILPKEMRNVFIFNELEKQLSSQLDLPTDLVEFYKMYFEFVKKRHIMTFSFMVGICYRLLKNNAYVIKAMDGFKYFMVDEIQDLTPVQYEILKLFKNQATFFFTGDKKQSIYRWRMADPRVLDWIKKDFDISIFELKRSFRITSDMKNSVLKTYNLDVETAQERSGEILFYKATSLEDEAKWIARQIKLLIKKGVKPGTIAVLFRANYYMRIFIEHFLKDEIPIFVLKKEIYFYKKEVQAVLQLVEGSLKNDITYIEPFLKLIMPSKGKTRQYIIKDRKLYPSFQKGVYKKRIDQVNEVWHNKDNMSVGDFIIGMLKALDFYKLKSRQTTRFIMSDLIDIGLSYSGEQKKLFIDRIQLFDELEISGWKKDRVRVLTVHQAKGLEFDAVFLPVLIEGFFPLSGFYLLPDESKEERSLFYVALTRTKKNLYLSYPQAVKAYTPYHNNHWLYKTTTPSRFLLEIFNERV